MTTSTRQGGWRTVDSHARCPICGKADWCAINEDGRYALCNRVSDGSQKQLPSGGWLHWIGNDAPRVLPPKRPTNHIPDIDALALARSYNDTLMQPNMAGMLRDCAMQLGAGRNTEAWIDALKSLKTGYSHRHWAFTFPMRDDAGAVIGIRVRSEDGRKWAVTGSRAGIFIPSQFNGKNTLYIVEGPTDTAAMTSIGLNAIGRSSCRGDVEIIKRYINRHGPDPIIVADNDGPGHDGAEALAKEIAAKVIVSPFSKKDPRQAINDGATARDFQ